MPSLNPFNLTAGAEERYSNSSQHNSSNTLTQEGNNPSTELTVTQFTATHNTRGGWGPTEKETDQKEPHNNTPTGKFPGFNTETSEQNIEQPSGVSPPLVESLMNLHDPALKTRFDRLVQSGKLCSQDIQVLETTSGLTLIKLLECYEIVWPKWRTKGGIAPLVYPYRAVHVLQIQWEEHDLTIADEDAVNDLKILFQDTFGFESVESFRIPSQRSYKALEARLQEFKQQYSSEQSLLVVYYSGHGFLDSQNRMHWSAKR
jgi:hypothetical protein